MNEVEIKDGDRVLIHGAAGGVGLFATQFAKAKGAYVIGICGPDNVNFVRSLGTDEVIDYRSTPFEQSVQNIDVLFDTIGGQTLERSWPLVRKGGTLISIVDSPAPERAEEYGIQAIKPTRLASGADLREIALLLGTGQVKAVISESFPLDEARQAHERCQTGHGRGRIVLRITE